MNESETIGEQTAVGYMKCVAKKRGGRKEEGQRRNEVAKWETQNEFLVRRSM